MKATAIQPTAIQRAALLIAWATVGTWLTGTAGCGGPNTVPVQGRVEFADGQPVRTGRIEFRAVDAEWRAMSEIAPDGSFALTTADGAAGLPPGDYEIIVVQLIITEDLARRAHGDGGHGRNVPRRYADYYTSGLRATVTDGGANDLRITIVE